MIYTGIRRALVAGLIVGMAAAPAFANHHEETEQADNAITAPTSIAAAAISVSDLDAATAFYTQGLGMSVVRNSSGPGYVEAILSTADAEGTKLALIQVTEGEASIGPSRIVFYTEDAAGMIDAIRAAGFEVEREAIPVREGMSLIIAIGHDGDGNTLEFIQR